MNSIKLGMCLALVIIFSAAASYAELKIEDKKFLNTRFFNPSTAWANANSRALVAFSFTTTRTPAGIAFSTPAATASVQVRIEPLFYPNPFRLDDGAELGYQLSKESDVEVRIYTMFGKECFRDFYSKGSNGGFGGDLTYNKIRFNRASFGGQYLPVGVYLFLLISEGKILGKGRFAIKP